MAEINIKRTGKKLGLIFLGMIVFLLIVMWFKGLEFRVRVFVALFAGLSAWMGIISLVIWLWKETNREDPESKSQNKE
jgi:galactitol-specific phosphotransferase system IIC component